METKNNVPALDELKKAHYRLFQQYYDVLNKASELPFFIVIPDSISHLETNSKISRLLIQILGRLYSLGDKVLFRFLRWKPLVNFFLEIHIRNKSIEISKIYRQLAATLDRQKTQNQDFSLWLTTISEETQRLGETLSSNKNIKEFVAKLGGALLTFIFVIFEADNIHEIIKQIFSQDLSIASFVTIDFISTSFRAFFYTSILLTGIIWASFSGKRYLLYSRTDEEHVYKTESIIFELLNRQKKNEVPIDLYFRPLPILVIAIFVVLSIFISFPVDQRNTKEFWLTFLLILGVIIFPSVASVVDEWKHRKKRRTL